ncbi:hypothetical protein FACS189450_11840 [Spirochaetia bacterium]|nr:hypothetical protein FACS189450_11840 [Spirochaetia bacterium]
MFAAIFFIVIASMTRGESFENSTAFDIVYYILYSQGNTIGLPLYYLDNRDMFMSIHSVPFLLSDILSVYFPSFFSVQDQRIISRQLYYSETIGLGRSLICEILDFKLIIVPILFSVFVGIFINFVQRNIFRNTYLISFFIICSMSIIYLPRGIFLWVLDPMHLIYITGSVLLLFSLTFFRDYIITLEKREQQCPIK